MFTLNVVGIGSTWESMRYYDTESVALVNPLCGETDAEKEKYHSSERILFLNSDSESAT